MKKEDVILSCYSLLRKETPLNFDCGMLCKGKCCKGDETTGMLVFPGEEKLLDENIIIRETKSGDKIAVCNGSCDRNKRPLSCRIFPLFPVMLNEENGEIKIVFDYRAECPLKNGEYKFEKSFVKKVKRVGKYLMLNEETKAVYLSVCADFNEYEKLLNLLEKKF